MSINVKLKYLRIAPRKVRLVADLIRGKKLEEAQTILNFTIKRASNPLLKLLKQAEANAKNNFQMEPSNLFISKIMVNEGPKYKKWEPRARGQAYEIQEKTSHIEIIFDEIVKKAKKKRGLPVKAQAEEVKTALKPEAEEKISKPEKTLGRSPTGETLGRRPTGETLGRRPTGETLGRSPTGETLGRRPTGETLGRRPATGEAKTRPEKEMAKPRTVKGLRKIFQRKVF